MVNCRSLPINVCTMLRLLQHVILEIRTKKLLCEPAHFVAIEFGNKFLRRSLAGFYH